MDSKPRIELQFLVSVNLKTMWKQVDLLKKRYVVLVSGYKILLGGATEIDLDARLGAMTALGSAQRSSRTAL